MILLTRKTVNCHPNSDAQYSLPQVCEVFMLHSTVLGRQTTAYSSAPSSSESAFAVERSNLCWPFWVLVIAIDLFTLRFWRYFPIQHYCDFCCFDLHGSPWRNRILQRRDVSIPPGLKQLLKQVCTEHLVLFLTIYNSDAVNLDSPFACTICFHTLFVLVVDRVLCIGKYTLVILLLCNLLFQSVKLSWIFNT